MIHHLVLKLLFIWICKAVFVDSCFGILCDLTRWNGVWFQSGVGLVQINGNEVTTKGRCIRSRGEKFLFEEIIDGCRYFRCRIIVERHKNVLQYKETFADDITDMDSCDEIPTDAVTYTLIRANAKQVACPFKGAFAFTYNRSYEECRTPVSTVNTCAEVGKIELNFYACPGVPSSERKIVDMLCFATWTVGSSRFMFGQMTQNRLQTGDDAYRCFLYDEVNPREFHVAVSGNATCPGLGSPTEGAMTLNIKIVERYAACQFPNWMTRNSLWHFKDDNNTIFYFSDKSTIYLYQRSSKIVIRRLICHFIAEIKGSEAVFVARNIQLCRSNYVCILFERQPDHTVVWHWGDITPYKYDACEKYFSRNTAFKSTLLASTASHAIRKLMSSISEWIICFVLTYLCT